MERTHTTLATWQDRLDSRWRVLPSAQKRRIVRYSFAFYLIITASILLQVIFEVDAAQSPISIEHINNPVAKYSDRSRGTTEMNKPKIHDNERE